MKRIARSRKLLFFRQIFQDFHHTGAISPSSKYLANAITSPLALGSNSKPLRVLEVGAGTGVFTRKILKILPPKSQFDIYECNSTFSHSLRTKVLSPPKRENLEINLHEDYIQNLKRENFYDFLICGLPFNNFHPDMVKEIFKIMILSLRDGGSLSFFEYLAVRPLKRLLCCERGSQKLKQVGKIFRELRGDYSFEKNVVFRNLPPAVAWHLKIHKKNIHQ